MKKDPVAQSYLKSGRYDLYGTYFHNRVFKRLRSAGIEGLEIDKTVYRPNTNGGAGNMRRPDFQLKINGRYIVMDLKPNGYDWKSTRQYADLQEWLNADEIIQLNYNR